MNKKVIKIFLISILSYLLLLFFINISSITEGIKYLFLKPEYVENNSIKEGEFKTLYDLVVLDDNQRADYIKSFLGKENISYLLDLNTLGGENIFVSSDKKNFDYLFVAHYDTFLDKGGALDNTGSVSVLLSAVKDSEEEIKKGRVAFLFTANEEDGLVGSKSFIRNFVDKEEYSFNKIINLDCIGAGETIAVAFGSTQGLVINLFPFGKYIFDGNKFSSPKDYNKSVKDFVDYRDLDLKVKNNIVAYSDSLEFIKNEMSVINLTSDNMDAIVNYTHRKTDTPKLLKENYLKDAKDIVVGISQE